MRVFRHPSPEAVYSAGLEALKADTQYTRSFKKEPFNDPRKAGFDKGDRKWYGLQDKRENESPIDYGQRLLTEGDQAALKVMGQTRDELLSVCPDIDIPSRKRKLEDGHTSGFDPSLSRIIAGHPDAFRRHGRRINTPRAIQLVVELGGNAFMEADQLRWAGAVGLVASELLADAGYAVEVLGVFVNEGDSKPVQKRIDAVMIKSAEQQLVPDQLASVIASPVFFRVGMFANYYADEDQGNSWGLGHMCTIGGGEKSYGYSVTFDAVKSALELERPFLIKRCYSLDEAKRELYSLIARINTPVE